MGRRNNSCSVQVKPALEKGVAMGIAHAISSLVPRDHEELHTTEAETRIKHAAYLAVLTAKSLDDVYRNIDRVAFIGRSLHIDGADVVTREI